MAATLSRYRWVLLLVAIIAAWSFFAGATSNDTDQVAATRRTLKTYFNKNASRPGFVSTEREPCAQHDELRSPFFGALHIHTAQSFDAYVFGTRNRPDDAYRFARGGTIDLPPMDTSGQGTRPIKLATPLDFAAVTDHAEHLGEVLLCSDPSSPAYTSLNCRLYRLEIPLPVSGMIKPVIGLLSLALHGGDRAESICGTSPDNRCIRRAATAWNETQRAAEGWYDRSSACRFTTFVGYEYSLGRDASNMHRNVIFANGTVPPNPLSAKDAPQPENLWRWLQDRCIDSGTDCDALAIPHNSNWSNGRMFFPGWFEEKTQQEQAALGQLRHDLEPLVEVMQIKGDSECRNGLYNVAGAPDEFCDFEKQRPPLEPTQDCENGFGSKGMMLRGCVSRWSYARYGLIQGLAEQKRLGVNPFQYGLIAASDTHNATGGAVEESDFQGQIGQDWSPERRLISSVGGFTGLASSSPVRYNPGGLAALWAEENTRESLFAAMQRREAYGTSGPRIVARFFGGWDYPDDLCESARFVETGYARGVAMGGTLPEAPSTIAAPVFAVHALRDADERSGNLQRIQIIKGWMGHDGLMHQKVFDVTDNADNGATVDLNTCSRSGTGHASLCNVWRDPAFDPTRSAVYYARILENPSCRWSTHQCNVLPADQRPDSCSDPTLPKTVQERAWTSPIWYRPPQSPAAETLAQTD